MPKRIVDGEGLWGSRKILALEEEHKAEYANLLPLAEANGTFELDPYKIWTRVYAYNRRSITPKFIGEVLMDLAKNGLLMAWEEDGKVFAYWEGHDKAGRLPGYREQGKYKNLPPDPPLTCTTEETVNLLSDYLRNS